MQKLVLLVPLILCGCGNEPTEPVQQQTTDTQPVAMIDWYQDNLSVPIQKVGIENAQNILDSTGLKPVQIIDSTDPKGELKKIYKFSESVFSAQFEHSPNVINLMWYQVSESPNSIENSNQSLKDIYLIARALLGEQGSNAVRHLSKGGHYKNSLIENYQLNGQCNGGICVLNIHLKL